MLLMTKKVGHILFSKVAYNCQLAAVFSMATSASYKFINKPLLGGVIQPETKWTNH